jgi:hypothetical protein
VFISGRGAKQGRVVRDLVATVAQDPHGGGARAIVLGAEELIQERLNFMNAVQSPAHPEGLYEVMFKSRIALIERGTPLMESGHNGISIASPQLATSAIAGAVFR